MGFIGRNLIAALGRIPDTQADLYDLPQTQDGLLALLPTVDFVFHLAGVNRPQHESEFETVNAGLTRTLVRVLQSCGKRTPVLLASSTQALLDNPYGSSKRSAEKALEGYASDRGARVYLFRLPNVFGKWCRPNYNSVVATFCHNVARGLPLEIHEPGRVLQLAHVDDVVSAFLSALRDEIPPSPDHVYAIPATYQVTLQDLADRIRSCRDSRGSFELPPVGDVLSRLLYSTYLTHIPVDQFAYPLDLKRDGRGWLAEFLRSPGMGQVFVSSTRPGVTRGNHWHDTKTEKFLVLEGEALIRLRPVAGGDVLEYRASGQLPQVVDIPPGYTHCITNVGGEDLITLFWASEPFDPAKPDTHPLEVDPAT
jgi:UDP-2-acetamido-2,6-beta-L-arabino-hexul-4-ose reductase